MKNHSRASARGGEGRRWILDLSGKKTKKLPTWQAYSKLFYDTKIKDQVRRRWKAYYLSKNPGFDPIANPTPPPPLKFLNMVTKELYEQESAEVKDEVERSRVTDGRSTSVVADADGEDELSTKEQEKKTKALNYQKCVYTHLSASFLPASDVSPCSGIDALHHTMTNVLDEIYTQTGLVGMAIFAGPEPRQGGNLCIVE